METASGTANASGSSPVLQLDSESLNINDTVLIRPKKMAALPKRHDDGRMHLSFQASSSPSSPSQNVDVKIEKPLFQQNESGSSSSPSTSTRGSSISMNCIAVNTIQSPDDSTTRTMVSSMKPPNSSSVPTRVVGDGVSAVADRIIATPRESIVKLHVYDLSKQLLKSHSMALLGVSIPGIYHSAIACFGLEFYFEGGVAITAAGRTRFGKPDGVEFIGSTHRTITEFLLWVKEREETDHQIHDYHLTRHNCHHFSEVAARFLCGPATCVPRYLFDTVKVFEATPIGGALVDAMVVTTCGLQSFAARMQCSRIKHRRHSLDELLMAATVCGVMTLPPNAVVVFRTAQAQITTQTLLQLEPYTKALVERGVVKPLALTVLQEIVTDLVGGMDTLSPGVVTNFVDIVVTVLLEFPLAVWGPALNCLRIALLHQTCLITCVFHPKLLPIITSATRDFPRMLPDGRLALLRSVCNLSCSAHGALVYIDARYHDAWVSLTGLGLMDREAAIVYTAACLAVNIALACVATATTSLRHEMSKEGGNHYLLRLATILLYNLRFRTVEQLPEPTLNMVLLALYHIMSSNISALMHIVLHSYKLRYSMLLDRCETNESRGLLCLMKALQDLST